MDNSKKEIDIMAEIENVIFKNVNQAKNVENKNMTVNFCNFKHQKRKMTQMFNVDNYVENGDFFCRPWNFIYRRVII